MTSETELRIRKLEAWTFAPHSGRNLPLLPPRHGDYHHYHARLKLETDEGHVVNMAHEMMQVSGGRDQTCHLCF